MVASLADLDFQATTLASLDKWRPGRGGVAAVVFCAENVFVAIAEFVAEYPHIPVIAVAPELELASFAAAVRAGATGVIDDADSLEALEQVVSAALAGRVSVPHHLADAMARRIPATPDADAWVSEDEANWLIALAQGATVASLAERIGYSERETYRTLGDLYGRLGVTNRTEAIIWATRHGVLDT
jgi:DNA-binding NarL/FixJ family response regulator